MAQIAKQILYVRNSFYFVVRSHLFRAIHSPLMLYINIFVTHFQFQVSYMELKMCHNDIDTQHKGREYCTKKVDS